jgi:hypothetical protein
LDGHGSRRCFEGIDLFDCYGVDVVTFPGHSTHVLQVFDISIAAPVKDLYQRILFERLRIYLANYPEEGASGKPSVKSAEIKSFLEAWEERANRRNIESGFRKSGILPFDPNIPLSYEHVIQGSIDNMSQRKNKRSVSSTLLTDPETLLNFSEKSRTFDKELRVERSAKRYYEVLNTNQSEDGRVLSAPESFLWWIAHDDVSNRTGPS